MDSRRQILEMLAEGKVQPDEAMRLMSALKGDVTLNNRRTGRSLVMQVLQDDSVIFNLRMPLALVRMGVKLIPRNTMIETHLGATRLDLQAIKWDDVIELATRGDLGEILHMDVEDPESGSVQIRLFCE